MAKIWPVYKGNRPTPGWPWAELPLAEAIQLLELRPGDFLSDLDVTPRFGFADRDLTLAGFKHVVVEVDRREGEREKWKPGFYRSLVKPKEALSRLIQWAMAPELGAKNVQRVDWGWTTDSQGREALGITVVITPDAPRRLKGGATLRALVRLREQLPGILEERTPIIQYATEAELRESAGS